MAPGKLSAGGWKSGGFEKKINSIGWGGVLLFYFSCGVTLIIVLVEHPANKSVEVYQG